MKLFLRITAPPHIYVRIPELTREANEVALFTNFLRSLSNKENLSLMLMQAVTYLDEHSKTARNLYKLRVIGSVTLGFFDQFESCVIRRRFYGLWANSPPISQLSANILWSFFPENID